MNIKRDTNDNAPVTRTIDIKNVLKAFSVILAVIVLIAFLVLRRKTPDVDISPPSTEESLLEQENNLGNNLPGSYGDIRIEPVREIEPTETQIVQPVVEPIREIVVIEPEKPRELTEEELYQLERAKMRRQLAEQARVAPLQKSGKGISSSSTSANYGGGAAGSSRANDRLSQMMMQNDPNGTQQKKEFAAQNIDDNFILDRVLVPSISRYEVKAGTLISVIFTSWIESDNPGKIVAVVREDVYDTLNGNHRLIPKGSRLLGEYNSDVSFGQERLQIIFTRLTLPNGKSISLGTMLGGDGQGRSGVKDRVNTHMGRVFTSVLMSALLGAGAAVVSGNNTNDNSWEAAMGQGAGEQILAVGNSYAERVLNVQPTLQIRSGTRATLLVDRDMILEPYNPRQEFLAE